MLEQISEWLGLRKSLSSVRTGPLDLYQDLGTLSMKRCVHGSDCLMTLLSTLRSRKKSEKETEALGVLCRI